MGAKKSVMILILGMVLSAIMSLGFAACGGGGGGGGNSVSGPKLGITTNFDEHTATIFNAETLQPIKTFDVCLGNIPRPIEVVLSEDGLEAYIVCHNSNSISIISMSQYSEIGTVPISGNRPFDAVVAPDGYLYVSYDGSPIISKIMVTGNTPAEVATIGVTIGNTGGLDVTPDGQFLYVGNRGDTSFISKVDISAMSETATFDIGQTWVYDIKIDSGGKAYIGVYDTFEIPVWDTTTDSMGSPLPLGIDEVANGFAVDGNTLYISNGTTSGESADGGALSIVDINSTWVGYSYGQHDNSWLEVGLPFTFPFMGSIFNTVFMSSNGHVDMNTIQAASFDIPVGSISGFAGMMEDLDSGDGKLLNYSARAYSHHAAFQWCSATNSNPYSTSTTSVFEIVLNEDGTARFDYRFSMPASVNEDDGYSYGVGNGIMDVMNMRSSFGTPFNHQNASFLWSSAIPSTMSTTSFTWTGTGALHLPVENVPHGIALTDDFIFLPGAKKTGNLVSIDAPSNVVEVYHRATLLPAGKITVGFGPRGIAVQP